MHSTVPAKRLDGFQKSLGTVAEVAVQQDLPLLVEDTQIHPAGHAGQCHIVGVGFGVESHQVSSLWKVDTSWSIPNWYAPRGGLDEYQRDEPDRSTAALRLLLAGGLSPTSGLLCATVMEVPMKEGLVTCFLIKGN
jgi:hypothetical protein